jgi:hypothetical protein
MQDVPLKDMFWREQMKGLIIKKRWLDLILEGKKPWEIRGNNTKTRGIICLIESGSGEIKGTANLKNAPNIPLSTGDLEVYKYLHCIDDLGIIKYKTPYVWEFSEPHRLDKPIAYNHPRGAVIWVNLPDDILEGMEVK